MSLRTPHSALRIRQAFTLTELLVASVSATILLAALGSTMYIARQVAYSPVHAQKLLDGTNMAFELVDTLKHAVYIVDHATTYIEFVTADRDGDGIEDSFRYEWSGTAGDALRKSVNGGTPVDVLETVEFFQLGYQEQESEEQLEVLTEGAEQSLAATYSKNGDEKLVASVHFARTIDLSGMPSGARSWSLSKISYQADNSGGQDGSFAVQLRRANSDGSPSSEVIHEWIVAESSLPSWGWYNLYPPQRLSGLSFHDAYCVVFKWLSGPEAAKIGTTNSVSGMWSTTDDGATWTQSAIDQLQVVVHAKPETVDAPVVVPQSRLLSTTISLQVGNSGLSRIDTKVTLDNKPQLVEKAWMTDFEYEPTLQDANGDGDGDFVFSGGTFDMASVVEGAWQASGYLQAENSTPITTPVLVDVCGQSLGTGGRGLVARAVVRLAANEHADVAVSVVRQPDGTQTASLLAYDGATTHVLTRVPELPAEPLDVRLVIEPTRRLAAIRVNGVHYPVASIPAVNASVAMDSFTFTEEISNAVFDYTSVVVCQ
jgi:hypothetical protein